MNSNIPKSSTQVNNPVKISSLISNQSKANNQRPTSNISSLNRVSILKTEEQKEIVRTNVYDPNDSSPGRSQKFTVVTEIIHRKSNIPFDSKYHSTISLNKMTNNFSFNQNAMEPALNQTFQNQSLNINIVDTNKKTRKIKNEESYNLLIKRIASQLNIKVRPPTHGYFFFALQKGGYSLMIIKKFEKQIINHNIELNSDFFKNYTQRYFRYKELVQKIASLLKKNLKNKENQIFQKKETSIQNETQSIQVKVTNNNKKINMNNKKDNINNQNNLGLKKNVNNNSKSNLQNKKILNIKNIQNIQIKKNNNLDEANNNNNIANNMNNNIQKKNKNISNNNKIISMNNNSHLNQKATASHKLNVALNPFSVSKAQNQKKNNLTKKTEFISNKNNLSNKIKSKNVNNNILSNTETSIEKVKIVNVNKKINNDKVILISDNININNMDNDIKNKEKDINSINNKKEQEIILNKINQNNIPNNPTLIEANNDIEMNDDTNNANIINKANVNMNILINPDMKKEEDNAQKQLINNTNVICNNSNINQKNIQLNPIKSSTKKIQIKLSTFKKNEDIFNINIIPLKSTAEISNPGLKLELNKINIPSSNTNASEEHISFINKFNAFASDNDIYFEHNIPLSKNEKGQNILTKFVFWEKYIHYLYFNYLINNNKISFFSFIYLIEQYFLWCELSNAESNLEFKKLIIDVINKIYTSKEINQFFAMNKINNFDELFSKYESFMKCDNNNKNNFMLNKEVEIKIVNDDNCDCELCKNDNACIKRISELNKKYNENINTESLLIKAEYPPKEPQKLITDSYQISLEGKDNNGKFSIHKTEPLTEAVFQYIAPEKIINDKTSIKTENQILNDNMNEINDKKTDKEDDKEKFIEIKNNTKLEDFFVIKEKDIIEEKEEKEKKDNNNKKGNKKSMKRNSNKSKEKIEYDSEEKDKDKKKQKSKARNKSYNRKSHESDSDNDYEYPKNKNKKQKYQKINKKKGKK